MSKEHQEISTIVQLFSSRFLLTIFVKPDVSYKKGDGFLSLLDKEETFIADNLSYFVDIDSDKKQELKSILKTHGFESKGCAKELKALLKRANELGILK